MAKKTNNKKEKTPTQLKNHYKRVQYGTFIGEFVSVFTPFVAIGIVNYDKYFVQYNGTKMSIACFLAFALMGIAIFLISKKKLENTYIGILIGWGVITFIFFLLGELITDMATIMLFGWFGLLGAEVLDVISKKANKKATDIQKGIDAANEELTKNAYIQEVENKRLKVKVKKKTENNNNENTTNTTTE